MRAALRTTLLITIMLCSACGFHLRGSLELPPGWDAIEVTGASPNGELQQGLIAGLEAAGVVVDPQAGLTLHPLC